MSGTIFLSKNLFLDDERNPADVTWCLLDRSKPFDVVRNYLEFVTYITSHGVPDYVTFDHDLADEHYAVMLKEAEAHSKFSAFVNDDHGGLTLTFDYGSEKTGYDCAKWLVEYCVENNLKFPSYTVHSMNPVGRERINSYIINAKKHLGI